MFLGIDVMNVKGLITTLIIASPHHHIPKL